MALQNFVDFLPPSVKAAWLNAVDVLKFTVFDDASTKALARTALQLDAQLVANGVDSGAANAAVVTLSGPITGYVRATGSKVSFTPAATNTGATTLNVNGTGAASVVNQQGNALTGGELSRALVVEWTGTAWKIIAGSIPPEQARTSFETAAAVVPTDYNWLPGYVNRYGADPTGVVSSKTAIQNAINVAKTVYFTDGTYLVDTLTSNTNNQVFIGLGDVTLRKQANGAIWTASGRDMLFQNIKFNGVGATFTGSNLVIEHDNCTLLTCGSRDAAARAVLVNSVVGTASGLRILGTNDIYQTADATGNGWDIEIAGNGGNYNRIISVTSSQSTGGILIDNASCSISDSQFGKLRVQNNGGMFVCNNRINGVTDVRSSNNVLTNNTYSASVNIGNGATNYSNIVFSDSNVMQNATTFTLNSGIIDSVIHVGQLQDSGVTVTLSDAGDNFVVSRAIAYTPAWTAATANPAIGNGSFPYATYTRKGRRMVLDVSLLMGSTTTFGTGTWRIGLPTGFTVVAGRGAVGTAWLFDATNVPYTSVAEALTGLGYITFYSDQVGGQVSGTNPFAWAQDDRLRFSIEFDVG